MGELININFNKKPVETGAKTPEKSQRAKKITLLFGTRSHEAGFGGDEIKKIRALAGSASSYKISLETIKNYTDEELVEYLVNSNDLEIAKKPAFFNALLDELFERME